MADVSRQPPSQKELSELPAKAIAAYAVRAARRVQPLCVSGSRIKHEEARSLTHTIERALKLASTYASGKNVAQSDLSNSADEVADAANSKVLGKGHYHASHAAANAARAASSVSYHSHIARAAFQAAENAIKADDDTGVMRRALRRDFDRILKRSQKKTKH